VSGGTPPPSSGGASGFNSQVPKKPFYRRPLGIVLIVLGVIILLSFIGGISGGGDSSGGDTAADDSSETNDSKSAETKKSKQKPESTPQWKTVAKLRGNTNKAGTDFHLNGCDTRMTYNIQGDVASTVVGIYVMDSGTQLQEDGGFPVVSPTKTGPGKTTIRKDEGDYYIETVAANAEWRVRVQEKC